MGEISKIDGIGEVSLQKLESAGVTDIETLAVMPPVKLMSILDIGETTAHHFIDQADKYVQDDLVFTSASDVEPSLDFRTVDVPEMVYGWEVFIHSQSHIGWETTARYRLFIEGHQCRIWGHLPQEDQDTPHKITTQQVLQPQMESPEQAVEWAKEWMIKRALDPDSNLSKYTGVGKRLAEHLQIVYGVANGRELYHFFLEDKNRVEAVVGAQYLDQLEEELRSDWDTTVDRW